MATVPRSGPQVSLRPLSPVYQSSAGATPDAFGAAGGRALDAAGRQIGQTSDRFSALALRAQMEDNERVAKDLDIKFTQRVRLAMYGDGTEENPGYYNARGQDAIDGYASAQEAIAKARQELLDTAPNTAVKDSFGQVSAMRTEQEFGTMGRFIGEQRRIANDTVSQARLQEAADSAAAAWNDPKIMAQSLAIANGEIADMADRNGWAPEVTASKMGEARTLILKAAILSALQADPMAAQAIYDANKETIDATARVDLEKTLETATIAVQSQEAAASILAASGGNLTAALAMAREQFSGKLEDEAVNRIKEQVGEQFAAEDRAYTLRQRVLAEVNQQYTLNKRAEAEAFKEASGDAYSFVYGGGSMAQWQRENPDKFLLLTADSNTISSLNSLESKVAVGQMFAPHTDGATLNELRSMDTKTLSEVNLQEYQQRLTQSEFEKAGQLQDAARTKIEKIGENTAIFSTAESVLKRFAPEGMKWGLASASETQQRQQNAIQNEMQAFVQSYIDQKKLPTTEELHAEALRLMLPLSGDTNALPFVGDFKAFVAEAATLTEEQKAVATVDFDDIPQPLVKDIRAIIKDAGVVPEDENALIEQLAAAMALNDRPRALKLLGKE